MEKLIRYRKAFYQKQNDFKNGNKKKEAPINPCRKSPKIQKMYSSVPHFIKINHRPRQVIKIPKSETAIYCDLYAQDIINHGRISEKKKRFLQKHDIDAHLRARMLDWMIEVVNSYKFYPKTYFDGIQLMDKYFQKVQEQISVSKLHIIGVASMLIASKMQQVFPLKIKTVFEKIVHQKISQKQLVQMQKNIAQNLDYNLNSWTIFDSAMIILTNIFIKEQGRKRNPLLEIHSTKQQIANKQQKKQIKQAQQICQFLAKFAFFNYDFLCENPTILLTEALVYMTLNLLNYKPEVHYLYTSSIILIQLCSQKLLKMIKNFKSNFPGLVNIYKYCKPEIIRKLQKQFYH